MERITLLFWTTNWFIGDNVENRSIAKTYLFLCSVFLDKIYCVNKATCFDLSHFLNGLMNRLSVPSSSCVFRGAGESEGGHGSSPSTGLHPSASEHVLPAHARPTDAAPARTFRPSSNFSSPRRRLFSAELSPPSWQLPVPIVVPPQEKSVRDAAVQWEPQDKRRDGSVSAAGEEKVFTSQSK